ncbi:MAG: exodeoxyribonuclease V subunit alpha [Candidatus Thiodiazotropha sp.]
MTADHASILPLNHDLTMRLRACAEFNAVDLYLANFLMTEAVRPAMELALGVALTSQATREGHLCLDLEEASGQTFEASGEMSLHTPALETWCEVLLASGVVGRPGEFQPLILDHRNRLYLHRYWRYEQQLADALLSRARQPSDVVDRKQLKDALDRLFPATSESAPDGQKLAAASAVLHPFTVISGGPGTGKTTTVVRLLALLRQQPGGEHLRIALAAPTGMAAARLQQSIGVAKSRLPLTQAQIDDLPETASTLHRLLGVQSQGTGFRYHRRRPLPLDLLILDEASMVDVALMAKLMEALPDHARLILLGDHHQLASVEAGAILGDLCEGCDGPQETFARELEAVTGETIEPSGQSNNRLSDHVVVLRKSYRFSDQSGIGQLAQAVNRGDMDGACRQLEHADEAGDLAWLTRQSRAVERAVVHFSELAEMIDAGMPIAQLFSKLYEFRVLCALRDGPNGVLALNRQITRRLSETGRIPAHQTWYPGRPVMITRNDYQLNLYNGEMGLVLPHPEQADMLSVAFLGADQTLRWVNPSRLPHCETVYALTVHKSQGSEYGHVLLILPDRDSPVLCRELLYTAITRAKSRFSLMGPEAVLKTTIGRPMRRVSGLRDRLRITEAHPHPKVRSDQ